jgi:hypothetical protein
MNLKKKKYILELREGLSLEFVGHVTDSRSTTHPSYEIYLRLASFKTGTDTEYY